MKTLIEVVSECEFWEIFNVPAKREGVAEVVDAVQEWLSQDEMGDRIPRRVASDLISEAGRGSNA